MKRKVLISIAAVLSIVVIVLLVVVLLHKRNSSTDVVITPTSVEVVEQESIDVTRPPALLDETDSTKEVTTVARAEFDYSGLEYWQQNALNTIAKTISDCNDEESVTILDVDWGDSVSHIVVEKNGQKYESDFNTKSFAIINE